MKVLVLGATGGTGRHVVAQAREAGHDVTAFDRKAGLSFAQAMPGHDAVISAIGRGQSFKSNGVIAQTVPEIIAAMKSAGVKRLVFTSAFGVGDSFADAPLVAKLFFSTLLRDIYADKAIGERLIRESGLDWTIVQPSKMTDGPLTGKYRSGERIPMVGMPSISRADTAHFLVSELASPAFVRKTVIVSQ